jgi:tristetraprolin
VKERPHSFSGGLSSADLRRLQQAGDGSEAGDRQLHQQQWAQGQYTQHAGSNAEQLSYPSLATHIHRPQPQLHPHMYDYRSGASQLNEAPVPPREELQIDYNTQQRNFNPIPQGLNLGTATAGPAFVQGRPNNNIPAVAYRPRGFPQQGQVTNSAAIPYPGGHVSHLSLGNTQQLYDMMLPGHPEGHHAAVTRVQQQHNVFRATHHHSASDPTTAMRDAAALLLNNNMPAFAPGMFQPGLPLPMYPNQYFGAQEQYPLPDANVMAARLQAQYTGPYAVLPPQPVAMEGSSVSSPTTSTNGPGPSANNRKLGLYKTELCRSWEEKGSCRYGTKCQFAHGEEELRKVSRHPKVSYLASCSIAEGTRIIFRSVQDGNLQG